MCSCDSYNLLSEESEFQSGIGGKSYQVHRVASLFIFSQPRADGSLHTPANSGLTEGLVIFFLKRPTNKNFRPYGPKYPFQLYKWRMTTETIHT